MSEWTLQEAKNRFSVVVNAAIEGTPQQVTRCGKPAVVVIAAEEYERLRHLAKARHPSFSELLLAMPQDDGEFERVRHPARMTDFDADET